MEIEYLYIDTKAICYAVFAFAVAIITKALLESMGKKKK